MITVLGIDPGSRWTGYGLVRWSDPRVDPEFLDHGVIQLSDSLSFAAKLSVLAEQLSAIYQNHHPQRMVVEKVFLGKNADSAFKLGHVRGVCLQQAGTFRIPVYEYAARSVKKAITGNGGASKEHVAMVVARLLGITMPARADASDALALALTHCRVEQVNLLSDRQKGLFV